MVSRCRPLDGYALKHKYPVVWVINRNPCWIHASWWWFSNMASEWLVPVLPIRSKVGKFLLFHMVLWRNIICQLFLYLYHAQRSWSSLYSQIAKFMGPTWGPPGSCRPQMGPMLAPCYQGWIPLVHPSLCLFIHLPVDGMFPEHLEHQVCFGISISNFICTFPMPLCRCLLIFMVER